METENKGWHAHGQKREEGMLSVNSSEDSEKKKYTYIHPEIEEENAEKGLHGKQVFREGSGCCGHNDNYVHECFDCCGYDHSHDHDHAYEALCCEHDCGHAQGREDGGCCSDGCGCGHDHGAMEQDEIRASVIRFSVGVALLIIAVIIPAALYPARITAFVAAYLVVGLPVLRTALRNIAKGRVFDENFLMALATVGAFALQKYPEAVSVMLFYNIGEMLSDIAVGHSRRSIAALIDLKPETATVVDAEGNARTVSPAEAKIGDIILVRPGERIPLDGSVLEGEGFVDNAALTGESVPVSVAPGQGILSGGVCGSGLLKIRVTALFADSTVSRILEMTQQAADKKAPTERFLTRFAAKYTPCVVIGALLVAILPPLLGFGSFGEWAYRALTVLVVSCPCALVLSVPLGFFGGIGRASKLGVLVKGGEALETLSKLETVVFDKTGTLTTGRLLVQEILPVPGVSEEACLALAAAAEQYSRHPAATAIVEAYPDRPRPVSNFYELPGRGIRAELDSKVLLVGNRRLMEGENVAEVPQTEGTVLFVAHGGSYVGAIRIADTVRDDAARAIARLHAQGVRRTVMLTGDTPDAAQRVADEVGIDAAYASLLPGDKVRCLEEVLNTRTANHTVAYVGDGINDAPVLKTADVGIAMGAAGTDAAVEAADVVIMTDNLGRVADAVHVAKHTERIIMQNIAFALGIKALVLVLTFFGLSEMWEAVFADVGVTVLTVFNAARILKEKS